MELTTLINTLQNLELGEDSFIFKPNMTDFDLSKPVVLEDILLRKANAHHFGMIADDDLPFEVSYTQQVFDSFAYKKTYTLLGILCFELFFSEQNYIELTIPDPQSEFKQLFIHVDRSSEAENNSFLEIETKQTFKSFEYFTEAMDKFPLSTLSRSCRKKTNEFLPTFIMSCSEGQYNYSKQKIEKADQLVCSTTLLGLIELASLFLDIGSVGNEEDEIVLENPICGFGGVTEQSIEAKFWLPNSMAFYCDYLCDLQF